MKFQKQLDANLHPKMRFGLGLILAVAFLGTACHNADQITVGVQPFGKLDQPILDTISSAIRSVYHVRVVYLSPEPLPKEAFVNTKSSRYRADVLIRALKDEKPDSLNYVVGITDEDISVTKRDRFGRIKKPESKYSDWGVFGLGYRPGPTSVVSTYRLSSNNHSIFLQRVKKVALHELGHNLGLDHCNSGECLMQDAAETIKTIDRVNAALCLRCKKKLE